MVKKITKAPKKTASRPSQEGGKDIKATISKAIASKNLKSLKVKFK